MCNLLLLLTLPNPNSKPEPKSKPKLNYQLLPTTHYPVFLQTLLSYYLLTNLLTH